MKEEHIVLIVQLHAYYPTEDITNLNKCTLELDYQEAIKFKELEHVSKINWIADYGKVPKELEQTRNIFKDTEYYEIVKDTRNLF